MLKTLKIAAWMCGESSNKKDRNVMADVRIGHSVPSLRDSHGKRPFPGISMPG